MSRRLTLFSLRISGRGATVAILFLATHLLAHESPEHVIEQLSARMMVNGTNAESLWERATEYRALGRLSSATRDLLQAARLRPDFLPVLADLAVVERDSGKTSEAFGTLDRALELAANESGRSPFYMARAELFLGQGEFVKALADCERAFKVTPEPEPEWYLIRGQLQVRLGQFKEAAAGLQRGFELTGHAVLEAEWIDTLLDGGQYEPALERIESRLAESRYQSSWLVRRARARLGLGQVITARGDLHAAITEITSRLNPILAEPTLLAERGLANALLGDREAALRDLKGAKAGGAESSLLYRLEKVVGNLQRAGL